MTILNKTFGLAAILAASVSGAAIAQSTTGSGDSSKFDGEGSDYSAAEPVDQETRTELSEGVASQAEIDSISGNDDNMLKNWTYADVASSLDNKTALSTDIASINAGTSVSTLKLSELKEVDPDISDENLDTAITASRAELMDMRSMIGANADFASMIANKGYSTENVIGVYQSANGSVHVLVDDRS